jgi:hypothetical protein
MAAVETRNPFFGMKSNVPKGHHVANPLQKHKQLVDDLTVAAASGAVEMYRRNPHTSCNTINNNIEDMLKNYINKDDKAVVEDVKENISDLCKRGYIILAKKAETMNDHIKSRLTSLWHGGGSRKSKKKRSRKTRRHRR